MARKERKVVTVLFADLVGFTSRAEELDPEDVDVILTRYHERLRAELERFGGTVEKFIGDAVMAVFGAPVAHEDDAERALRAALAIRDWAAEEGEGVVRIALNTGEALVSLDARPEQGQGFVAGDVVNTAARLQAAAPENGVLVSEATYSATKHVVEYREAEAVVAKGKRHPIPVWEAVQARSRFGIDVRQAGRAPLVGRERERALLVETFDRARTERSPQLVTLVGVPGIGKSRLVYALFEAIEQGAGGGELVTWRQGRCLPYGEGVSFWALSEIVKAHAGVLDGDTPEVARTKLETAVEEAVDTEDARWVERCLCPLVGVEMDGAGADDRSEEAFSAWRRFFEGLAEQRPLVLALEDLHWADDGLLDFVDELVEWSSGVPLLVLCSARPELLERRPGWGGGKLNALTLALAPLSEDESARLIAAVLDQAVLPATTQQALLERSGGNPLYAEQYARLYVERGSADDLPLPDTVHGLIAARLDTLPAAEKALLQEAAVMGKVFWSGALGDDDSLRERLHSLERKEFIRRERRSSVAGEDEYAFRHVLVRDVAYGQIPRPVRAAKHRSAAEWIEALGRPEDHAELLAHHFVSALELARASGEPTDELTVRAREALREAGDRAASLNAFRAAAGFYSAALELSAEDDPARAQMLFSLGRAQFHGEGTGEESLKEAAGLFVELGDPATAAEAESFLVELTWKRGHRDEANAHLERATELVADEPPGRAKATVLGTTSRYAMLAGDLERAIADGRAALAMAEELGLDALQAHVLNNIGTSRHTSGDLDGIADLQRAIEIARAIDSPEVLRAYVNLSSCLSREGRLVDSGRVERQGLELAERFGHEISIRWFRGGLAWTDYALGNWDAALAGTTAFIEEAERSPHYLESANRLCRGLIRLGRDDVEGALDDTERALELARAAKDPQALYPALLNRARVLAELGETPGASALADEFFDRPVILGIPFIAAAMIGVIAVDIGRQADALHVAATASGSRGPAFELAQVIFDRDFVRAADLLAAREERTMEAELRLRAAADLVAAGRRAQADVQLTAALAFFRGVKAARYVRKGEALLAASA